MQSNLSIVSKIILISFFCVMLIAIPLMILMQRVSINQKQKLQTIHMTGKPTIPITDLAPGVSNENKSQILIKHADSTFEEFLLPKAMITQYIQNMPRGDILISQKN